MRQLYGISLVVLAGLIAPISARPEEGLVQVRQDFSVDPGWEWKDNRVVAADPPTVRQSFGWASTNHTGAPAAGEIGGMVWQSRTPACYGLPLNRPLSFKDKFAFACRVAFMPDSGAGAAYLGFYNHEMQGWRVWNSMALRLGGESSGQAAIGVDAMTALWHACGWAEGFLHVPADGKPHTIRFSYDPQATPGDWPDPRLRKLINGERQTMEQMLELAPKVGLTLTKEELWKMLVDAHAEGLIEYLQRTGHESVIGTTDWNGKFWFRKEGPAQQGAMSIQVDDSRPFKTFIFKAAQAEPVYMDRFGLFNLQMYHQSIELYLSDLTVNDHKVDLSKDPGWEGVGNRVEFLEQDFQRQNYGFSETNWAGEQIGEIGGWFTSAETIDPLFGYYADDIGRLTLDDPIEFSGRVCYVNESTDSGMYIGFFNKADLTRDLAKRPKQWKTAKNSLGVLVEGSSKAGKFFAGELTTSEDYLFTQSGIPFRPEKKSVPFSFKYDPKGNNGAGTITVTLGDVTKVQKLTEQQRAQGGVFDRFGITNLRAGGKFVQLYFDDLTYTARRAEGHKPVFHKQEVVKTPFPKGGRKY